ncbi:MAG: hypothetical protein K6F82_04555 [Sphaerochaetaceae bacterium]|nr:hypothetical protein [Sphaerochaetaceae bacterium]
MKQFDIFILALRDFETNDRILYNLPRNRTALSHALAVRIMKVLEKNSLPYSVDMAVSETWSRKNLVPDILVHNREKGKKFLSVVCRNDYLSEDEQEELIRLSSENPKTLYLGLSFFPQKNYMLIYAAGGGKIEYLHFSRNTLTSEAVRVKTSDVVYESDEQMALKLNV